MNDSATSHSDYARVEDLLARQDEVIEQLELLEQRVIETIEQVRPSKKTASDPSEPKAKAA